MNKEKIVLSFIAVLVGLLVAGVAFYLYQSTKTIPSSTTGRTITIHPSPTPQNSSSIYISLASPSDEQVVETRTIAISGKTKPSATIIITTQNTDEVITPASNGNFSTTVTLENGENSIQIRAIENSTGEQTKVVKTVTYSTENF